MEGLAILEHFGVVPTTIIHVGANTGQEFEAYKAMSAKTVVYIEPISSVHKILKDRLEGTRGHYAVKALCSSTPGQRVRFNIANNGGESSSMLALSDHAKLFPEITYVGHEDIVTTTVDDLVAEQFPGVRFDLMVVDVQGAELLVLEGAKNTLKTTDAIYAEVSERPLYAGSCIRPQIDAFLANYGFHLKHLWIGPQFFGMGLYVKNSAFFSGEIKDIKRPGANIALNKPATQSSLFDRNRTNDAQGAVDGIIDGSYGFHTAKENRPWWQVDLGASFPLEEVIVFNRLNAGKSRAYSFLLKLGNEAGEFIEVYSQDGRPFGGADGNPARIKLNGAPARFVRIELPSEEHLHLDEVEVYAKL